MLLSGKVIAILAFFAVLQVALSIKVSTKAVNIDDLSPEELAELNGESAADDRPSEVVVLTDATFDSTVRDGKAWFVEFYAPWCGHCKNLIPTWEKLARGAKGRYGVAKVDCTTENELKTRFDIQGFPVLKFINNSQVYDYNGDRSLKHLKRFARKEHLTAPTQPIQPVGFVPAPMPQPPPEPEYYNPNTLVVTLSDANFTQATSSGRWLVEFYAPWCGHCKQLAPVWDQLATEAKSFTGKHAFKVAKVDCTSNEAVATQFGIQGYPTIKLIVASEGEVCEFNSARDIQGFKRYMKSGYLDAPCADIPEPPAPKAAVADSKDEL
eukprot:TRINITY_DN9627_c0_g1_i2.p1 TRINITY_DN9627_c0_g1~~TRINITY_DN9627_c0_g1_i2.p1  ORF type:complete len:324 (-),score=13.38 TRINITY_DN9627_c0_g1_i2:130-1101(-)